MRLSGAGGTYGWEGGGGLSMLMGLAGDWVEGVEGRGVRNGSVCETRYTAFPPPSPPNKPPHLPFPPTAAGISGAIAIVSKTWHTCVLVADSGVKCWGSNDNGQLGIGSTTQQNSPVDVPGWGPTKFAFFYEDFNHKHDDSRLE